ncbi:hypothetical protein [Pseudomonas sp. AL03]|uniref:hypothetical protein n=1 Tax=Pseudomonas sp. AL03 TaxID=3042230 RepID=UPI0032B494F4
MEWLIRDHATATEGGSLMVDAVRRVILPSSSSKAFETVELAAVDVDEGSSQGIEALY